MRRPEPRGRPDGPHVKGGARSHLASVVAATVLAVAALVAPAGVPPALAAGDLRIAADATYTLAPEDGRVRVAVSIRTTNLRPSTPTVAYFYRNLRFALQPGASAIGASDASGPLSITTDRHRFYTEAVVRLRSNLFYRETAAFTIRYDLRGGAPRSDSDVRVGRAFATFGVWAWGDAGRSSVRVRTPPGFSSSVAGSPMQFDNDGAGQVLTATPDAPDRFYSIVASENRTAYGSTRVSLAGGVEIVVNAWPEDDAWDETVSETLRAAMPGLMELVGLEWPVERDLTVRERYTPALEGYAGLFFTDEQRIDISEDLDPLTIVHEASHAWFDQDLFADRWIYEGLAEEYSWRVLTEIGLDAGGLAERPDRDGPGAIALGAWSFPQVIRDEETNDREQYGYLASSWVMHRIVEEAGVAGLRDAFAAAEANRTAYPGAAPPETVGRIDGWRRFLDLVEPIADADTDVIDDLLREYVLRPNETGDLDERDAARDAYRALVDEGGGWMPPWYVRQPMGEWRFDLASTRIGEADAVLALRDEVESAAGALGLEPGDALQTAYEATSQTFDGTRGIGEQQLAALEALADAEAKLAAELDVVEQVGLIGETPRVPYEAGRVAFERGDLQAASASAAAAAATISGAAAVGQERLLLAVAVAVVLLVLVVGVGLLARRRAGGRARRGDPVPAFAAPESAPVPSLPSATLATDPAPAPGPTGGGPPDVEGGPARGDSPVDP